MSLTARYFCIYRIWSFSNLGTHKLIALSPPGADVTLALTTDVSEHVDGFARKTAVANMALDGLAGGGKYRDLPFDEKWAAHTADEKARILPKAQDGVFLIAGMTAATDQGNRQTRPEIDLIFDAFPQGHFGRAAEGAVNRAIAALLVEAASNASLAVDKLFEYVVMQDEAGHLVYPLSLAVSATAVLSAAASEDIGERVRNRIQTFERMPELATPSRLLALSNRNRDNPLQSYLFGWSALEILAHKLFAVHHPQKELQAATATDAGRKPNSRTRMSLAERFGAVAEILGRKTATDDLNAFIALKKRRDAFVHDPDTTPPVTEINALAARYIQLHSDANSRN